jgi:RND family efflux transporter MFP subunit
MPRRTLLLVGLLLALLVLFVFVALRSGPLAPIAVTMGTVEARAVSPSLFGIGTVEPRFTYRIGPTAAGRVKRVLVDVGDRVVAGQLLGEMDAVDLDERIRSQDANLNRSRAALDDAQTRETYALAEARRYEQLLVARSTSQEIVAARQEAGQRAVAALLGAQADVARAHAERNAVVTQRENLRLVAPVDGMIASRDIEPGTTVVAGQMVLEIIDARSLWVNVRFDQGTATGLRSGLPATVTLRSRAGTAIAGHVQRVEPRADAVTEEALAKITFDAVPNPLPPIGELGEVLVALPAQSAGPVVPNAAVHRVDGVLGVWQVVDGDLRFTPVTLGASDAAGHVQVRTGLGTGDRIVVYSAQMLSARSRITVVDRIPGVVP